MHIQIPSFKAFLHAETVRPDQVMLFDEHNNKHLLEGRSYALLAPYLCKGTQSTDGIIEELKEEISAEEIYYALLRLEEKGFLENTSTQLPQSIQILCNLLNVSLQEGAKRLKDIRFKIYTLGNVSAEPLQQALDNLSLPVTEESNFSIIVTDNYRHPQLKELCLLSSHPYLLIKPTRTEMWIGPLYVPGKTACFECLLSALKNSAIEELLIECNTKRQVPITVHKETSYTSLTLAYNLAVNEIIKWVIQGHNADIESKLLSYHILHPAIDSHQVVRRPQCSHCGTGDCQAFPLFTLESQQKRFSEDGGHRIRSPEETYRMYEHLISPITGVIESLTPFKNNQNPTLHTYEASHTRQGIHANPSFSLKELRTSSGGKGKTAAQGKTSCLCEALERYSSVFQGNEPRQKQSYFSIQKDAIHPHALLLFSNEQYRTRNQLNRRESKFHWIPHPFDPSQEIDWTPVWSLTEQRFKWIPTTICYFGYPFSAETDRFAGGDSNGSAAGNTKEEAILQGFFELVERDSIALWWYSRFQCPGVDLASFQDPHIDRLISLYHSLNRTLWVIDITMDLNIPTFAAISCSSDKQDQILFGFGAHFDPKIAALRALTEMNQPLILLDATNTNRLNNPKDAVIKKWLQSATLAQHQYLVARVNAPIKRCQDYVRLDTPDIKEDILICQQIVESKGLEMLVLEQTRPEIGLPVVKVFVPGLRHFWNRYAPGRLYDVPFEMGLVKQKLTEQELNPIPFFF